MKVGRYNIKLTNEDKILFPDSGVTKGDLINYYSHISEFMLPHLKYRPLTLQRFPNGIGEEGFYQKDRPGYFPKWILSQAVPKEDGVVNHVICNNAATLVYLANQGVITLHTWLSRRDKPEQPDRLIFDLDPPGEKFEAAVQGAKDLRKILEDEMNLTSFIMTTGSKGLHVVTPIKRRNNFDATKQIAKGIAQRLADGQPHKYTIELRKNKRHGRLFIDYLRNEYAQTGVAPYSVRPRKGATVAVPLRWEELDDKSLRSGSFTIKNVFHRLRQTGDLWKDIDKFAGRV